ncbi:MAG: BON domain-containing protein, partial [Dongiaceae bacterium]
TRIRIEINHYWLQYSEELYRKVGLQVHEARVLLTGIVKEPTMRVDAVRLAWQAEGVREVINEIEVAEAGDLIDAVRDSGISRRLDAKLMLDREIRSINYSAVAVGGVVYLIGVAHDEAELQRVIDHARDIPYVRRVVSHVRVKNVPAP